MKNKEALEYILNLFNENNLSNLEYEDSNFKIKLGKEVTVEKPIINNVSQPVEQVEEVVEYKEEVLSPIVGTFYTSPAEGASPFVSLGDAVKKGQVLCIVEAMKVMNEIVAPCDGVISEILVSNAEGVEFNQPLFRLK